MNQINIIDKIQLTDKGLVVRGTKQEAHLRQGQLDGACAVYSMMMCLIIERIIKRNLVTDVPSRLKRNTADGRLVSYFLEKQGMVIDGYWLNELCDDLQKAFKKKVIPHYYGKNNDVDLIDEIINNLELNHPVEISFRRKGTFGHALVAVGYKVEGSSVTLYCLDPGYILEEGQIWNNILVIDTTAKAKYNCYNMKEKSNTNIHEILVFEKR